MVAGMGKNRTATDLYTYNFWPVAFKLPGIQAQDPKTAFIEANPARNSKGQSKKYADVGQNISANYEALAYRTNKVFDREGKGYITYGDMARQVNDNRSNGRYLQALKDMKAATNYVASAVSDAAHTAKDYANKVVQKGKDMVSSPKSEEDPGWLPYIWDFVKGLAGNFGISLAYPKQTYLISIGSPKIGKAHV